jgi:hypothetical protein
MRLHQPIIFMSAAVLLSVLALLAVISFNGAPTFGHAPLTLSPQVMNAGGGNGSTYMNYALADPVSTTTPAPCFKVGFSSPSYYTEALYGNMTIPVIRTGKAAQACSVVYHTIDDTAIAGIDYVNTSGTISFAARDTMKNITIPVTMDGYYTTGKHLQVKLSHPVNDAITIDTADIYINQTKVVLYFNMTKNTGTTVVDDSGNGNNGIAHGSTTTLYHDQAGAYIYFNNSYNGGYYDYVNVPNVPVLNCTGITMEAVFRSNKTDKSFPINPTFNTILIKRLYGENGYWFGTDGMGHPYAYFTNNGTITSTHSYKTYDKSTVCDNMTHWIGVSYNTSRWIWMVDGVVVNQSSGQFPPIGQSIFQLMLSQGGNNHAIAGSEYMVRVVNGAESSEQMLADYQLDAWRVGIGAPQSTDQRRHQGPGEFLRQFLGGLYNWTFFASLKDMFSYEHAL